MTAARTFRRSTRTDCCTRRPTGAATSPGAALRVPAACPRRGGTITRGCASTTCWFSRRCGSALRGPRCSGQGRTLTASWAATTLHSSSSSRRRRRLHRHPHRRRARRRRLVSGGPDRRPARRPARHPPAIRGNVGYSSRTRRRPPPGHPAYRRRRPLCRQPPRHRLDRRRPTEHRCRPAVAFTYNWERRRRCSDSPPSPQGGATLATCHRQTST